MENPFERRKTIADISEGRGEETTRTPIDLGDKVQLNERKKSFEAESATTSSSSSSPKEDVAPKNRRGTWSSGKFRKLANMTEEEVNAEIERSEGKDPKCAACGKTAYVTERIATDLEIFHKTCFKCCHCNNILKLGNYASLEGKYYCKPHFKQLFATKGNYNEGFGEDKLTKKWEKEKEKENDKDVKDKKRYSSSDEEDKKPAKKKYSSSEEDTKPPKKKYSSSEEDKKPAKKEIF